MSASMSGLPGGTRGRPQAVCQQIILERDGIVPKIAQDVDITNLQLEDRPLRNDHLRIGRAHLPILGEIQLIGAHRAGDHLSLVLSGLKLLGKIGLQ